MCSILDIIREFFNTWVAFLADPCDMVLYSAIPNCKASDALQVTDLQPAIMAGACRCLLRAVKALHSCRDAWLRTAFRKFSLKVSRVCCG